MKVLNHSLVLQWGVIGHLSSLLISKTWHILHLLQTNINDLLSLWQIGVIEEPNDLLLLCIRDVLWSPQNVLWVLLVCLPLVLEVAEDSEHLALSVLGN